MKMETTLPKIEDNTTPPSGMGILAIMGENGDTKHIWDKTKPEEVEAARVLFNTLVKDKKYLAFSVKPDGEKSTQIKEFDPNLESYIFSPPLQGG
jgi:hypothetical protein